jgi:fatty acid desaturase
MPLPSLSMTPEQTDAFGRELDALRAEIVADLGARDVDHIRQVMRLSYSSEAVGRALLHVGIGPVSFLLGTGSLALAKILENMEIGHNVMHGQYDWTRRPDLDSHRYEWDLVCPGDDWRHYHNYEHHTFTNILGKDRDIGYVFLRVVPEQPWNLFHLTQPISAPLLALLFQWGVGMHDLRINEVASGKQSVAELVRRARPFLAKAGWQLFKDYAFYPALALGNAPRVALGNLLANGLRNLWTFAVIFCGHFPEGVHVYAQVETESESRGQWYVRQVKGSANIEGGPWFHVLTGHLSHQIEHHLFPDIPAARYPEMASRVREICERYGQSYCTGSFRRQLGSVIGRIARLSLPGPRGASTSSHRTPAATGVHQRADGLPAGVIGEELIASRTYGVG